MRPIGGLPGCRRAALGRAHYRYWHNTGTAGTFGAVSAAATLLGLDAERHAHALATGATFAAGLQQAFRMDSMSKPLHAGHAAEAGVLAALAAERGVTGSLDVLDGDAGLGRAMSDGPDWHAATATLGQRPLRCEGGRDTGDNCLSDAQIAAVKVLDTPIRIDYPLANGERHYPGFNVWGSDFGRPGDSPIQALVNRLGLNTVAPAHPMPLFGTGPTAVTAYGAGFWDQWVRYFVTRDPAANSLTLDPQNPGRWASRISELTGLQDHNRTDLSPFAARGGKLLMAHGTADQLVSARATGEYFERIRKTMGAERVQGFLRYYEIPGYGHAFGTLFGAAWDSLTALEQWSERGVAPAAPVVADTTGVPGRTRPLCDYPGWPRYQGGDANAAASFRCETR